MATALPAAFVPGAVPVVTSPLPVASSRFLYTTNEVAEGPSSAQVAALAAFAAGAAAFGLHASSTARGSRTTRRAYKMSKAVPFLPASPALEGYAGEEDGFDPLGFSLAIDIRWLREAELKHGRVAMLATVGWIATDLGLRVPGAPFEQLTTIQAHNVLVKSGSMPHLLVWLGYAELFGFLAMNNAMEGRTDREAGDFGLRFLYPQDAKGQAEMQLKELRNGRLAMLAFSGIVTVSVLTQCPWPFDKWSFSALARPLSARAGQSFCGGSRGTASRSSRSASQALVERSMSIPFLPRPSNLGGLPGHEAGFDPLGISDTFDVKYLREGELKNGRVAMLACVGFVATQFFTFPGVPLVEDSLQAVWSAPPALWASLLLVCGYVESAGYDGKITMLDMFEGNREPGNFGFGSNLLQGKSEQDVKTMKEKELQNGRLAMLAFSGMVHHNLVVNGPLFPFIPDGWTGPYWALGETSIMGALDSYAPKV